MYPEIVQAVKSRFPQANLGNETGPVQITVAAADLRGLLKMLKDECQHDFLVFNTALDQPPENIIESIYNIYSFSRKTTVVVRVKLDRNHPEVPTVSDLYRTSEWHERETAELFGIRFIDHPDPRRLLLPDSVTGYPLRKDFTDDFLIPLPPVK